MSIDKVNSVENPKSILKNPMGRMAYFAVL